MKTRREFLKISGSIALIPLVDIHVASAAEKVSMDDPAVVALKYVEDATTAERADKMGVAGADQTCFNCTFYKEEAGQPGLGGCALFANKLVEGKGWCISWVPIPA